jgi:16S rRNA (cytidine1402-2'-O)-methyltransferase
LSLLGMKKKMVSYHKFNEHQIIAKCISIINQNEKVGLISDAGTPAISDPGYLIVKNCIEEGIKVECLPGATAFVPALVVSGMPTDRFCFEGFLPVKKGRKRRMEELSSEPRTLILYESPYRIGKTLKALIDYFGADRKVSVSRELSKKFEETNRGTLEEMSAHYNAANNKGEFVIVLEGAKI